ncbi:penicillin-binding protein [Alkalihalobacterium elongatum]|uniref:penicillin-binding protein n=1 Tax=Alkalihalobacterium elongatum TaxID=2675466 RepID=UPI001C1F21EC|nr:penicillin-binding protein [Alkalihalobacterium elongatum]
MEIHKRPVTNKRAVFIMAIFLICFVILIGRIIMIQTTKEVSGHDLQQMAEQRWMTKNIIEGNRGTILDRDGSALAQEINSYTMFAVLDRGQNSFVKDPRKTAEILSPHINMSVENLERLLSSDRFQVELGAGAKNMSHEEMTAIKEYELPGIEFRKEPRRYYPKQTYASHVIGYTERDMEKSRMGLELSLDELLRAEHGSVMYQRDRKGIRLPDPKETIELPKNGHDVYLTLDSNIQTALEQIMTKVEEDYKPERMIAIVADPKTGQILGMSNRPSFNPNLYEEITNYRNFAVSDRFEPGSTMKIFTLAAAIEEGVYNGNEEFKSGTYRLGSRVISDHNQGRGWGTITYDEGMQRSSNVAFSKIANEKLGSDKLYEYLDLFGFTRPTGIDLPSEATSLVAAKNASNAISTAFGQATAVTPIQQVQAATAIANNGVMMKPYVIDRVVDHDTGKVIEKNEPTSVGQPISEATAKQVIDVLETVVTSSAGTGTPYYIEGFDVVGKTGTAQVPNPDGPGYLRGHGKNIFSFLGMAPKDDPRVIVYVAVDRPNLKETEAGSAPVSQIFNTVMKHSLQYLSINPGYQEVVENEQIGFQLQDYKGKTLETVKAELESEGMDVIVLGDGKKVEGQQPVSGRYVIENERIILVSDGEGYTMPNIEGWSFRDVMKLSKALDLNMNIFGTGYVTSQSITKGSPLRVEEHITVELQLPSYETIQQDEDLEEDGSLEEQ